MKPRGRRLLGLAVVAGASALCTAQAQAAHYEFEYGASLSSLYSQDAERTGDSDNDAYLTIGRLGVGLRATTPRSETLLRYSPEYVAYDRSDLQNHLDHRLRTSWRLRSGPRSTFEVRQGFTQTNRQAGFLDLAGAGGNPSEPITQTSRRVAWDVQPRLTLTPSQGTSTTLEAIYRVESYDLATLVDSRQAGLRGGIEKQVGRFQWVGGWLGASDFSFTPDAGTYDRFYDAQASWARRIDERTFLNVGAGAYRSSGPDVESVIRPTLELSGQWTWRQVYLLLEYELRYASGGGISTANRSQWGHLALYRTWENGVQAGTDVGYIYRADPTATLGDGRPLAGRSLGMHLSKTWQSGLGVVVRVHGLQQERQIGPDLDYWEVALGLAYASTGIIGRPGSSGWRQPGGRAPRVP